MFSQRLFWLKILGGLVLLANLFAVAAWFFPQELLTVDSGATKAQALVVLGGGNHERPERAAELFKSGEAPLIICSGKGDAEDNAALLVRAGVPPQAILLEPDSRTTRENAQFTIALLRARRIQSAIIVTTWYHSRRALACFEHYAPDLKFYSRPSYLGFAKTDRNRRGISAFIRAEYPKTLGYWLRYGVWPI